MKRLYFSLILILILTGCNDLKRIMNGADSHDPDYLSLPEHWVISGTTTDDFQYFHDVAIANRMIRVFVKLKGQDEFRELNQYEFKVFSPSAVFSTIQLRYEIIMYSEYMIVNTGNPVAPTGTNFRIELDRTH